MTAVKLRLREDSGGMQACVRAALDKAMRWRASSMARAACAGVHLRAAVIRSSIRYGEAACAIVPHAALFTEGAAKKWGAGGYPKQCCTEEGGQERGKRGEGPGPAGALL